MSTTTNIARYEVIEDPDFQEALWRFYREVFDPIEEETPIAQTWSHDQFMSWMGNPSVIKLVAAEGLDVTALAVVTNNISIDYLLSPAYFAKYYPGKEVWNFPVIAIKPERRGMMIARKLIKAMMAEVPENAVGVLTHSATHNPLIPKLALAGCGGAVTGKTIDAEACFVMEWSEGR